MFLREAGVIPYSRKNLKFIFTWLSKNRMSVHVQATFGAVRMAPPLHGLDYPKGTEVLWFLIFTI